jgi:hypothetical protein
MLSVFFKSTWDEFFHLHSNNVAVLITSNISKVAGTNLIIIPVFQNTTAVGEHHPYFMQCYDWEKKSFCLQDYEVGTKYKRMYLFSVSLAIWILTDANQK